MTEERPQKTGLCKEEVAAVGVVKNVRSDPGSGVMRADRTGLG